MKITGTAVSAALLIASLAQAAGDNFDIPMATPARAELHVRGTTVDLPFQLRILVSDFAIDSPRAQAGFEVTGHDLGVSNGPRFGNERMRCRKLESFTQILFRDFKAPKESFICDTGKKKIIIDEKGLVVSPGVGFLSLDKKIYRGELSIRKFADEILLINSIPVEPYLAGLANKEMGTQFPDEAIKAQIIAARSYALATAAERRAHGALYDLKSSELDQVYSGFIPEDSRTYRLARETQGQVLIHREDVLKAFYHASNGGYSELPSAVWGDTQQADELAYLARKSPIDLKMETARWSVFISPKMGLAWRDFGEITDIRVLERDTSHRIKHIRISGLTKSDDLSGPEFRARFGPRWIKSTLFSIKRNPNGWMIEGHGWGHGVGLSQWGAKAMAEKGQNAESILQFYYPNASVRRLDLDNVQTPTSVPVPNQLLVR